MPVGAIIIYARPPSLNEPTPAIVGVISWALVPKSWTAFRREAMCCAYRDKGKDLWSIQNLCSAQVFCGGEKGLKERTADTRFPAGREGENGSCLS